MRNLISGRLITGLAVSALLFTAACGDDDDDTETGEGDATEATEPEDGGDGGTLTVCTDAPYEPFEFEEGGEFTGFDMELLREIAGRLDMEMEVTVQPFDGIWLAPEAGTCDIVASAMTITEERQEGALFSDPYFEADQSLLVRADDEETYATLDDLGGATIGVQTGTTGQEYAEENAPDADIRDYDEPAAMFLALESAEIDAILQDFPVNGYRTTQDDSMVVTETFETGEEYGFAAALDNEELIEDINDKLAEVQEDGTYDEIYQEWFGQAPE
jgi:polar amino acid transport system substrate-binding protein